MLRYRMVCLDIDGTLLNENREITDYAKEVIHTLEEMGVAVVLVSARMPGAITAFTEELSLKSPVISFGGSTIASTGRVYRQAEIDAESVEKIVTVAESMGIHTSIYQDDTWFAPAEDKWVKMESHVGTLPMIAQLSTVIRDWKRRKRGSAKILVLGDEEKIGEFYQIATTELCDCADTYVASTYCLEIFPRMVNKAEAIEFLGKELGFTLEEVIAIGDSPMDLPMIEAAGLGIAMGNASDIVKEKADLVAPSNREEGVGRILSEIYGLPIPPHVL